MRESRNCVNGVENMKDKGRLTRYKLSPSVPISLETPNRSSISPTPVEYPLAHKHLKATKI